jgi:hypothetical protein
MGIYSNSLFYTSQEKCLHLLLYEERHDLQESIVPKIQPSGPTPRA